MFRKIKLQLTSTIVFALVGVLTHSNSAFAQCANLLCATHDIYLPTNIINSSALPSLTVIGGNVGIGTNTPTAILDIQATGANSAIIVPRDSTLNRPVGEAGMIRYNTDLSQFEGFTSSGWGAIGGSAGGGSSQWADTVSGISYGSGNVGIGTASPEGALDVRGSLIVGVPNTQISNPYAVVVAKASNNPHIILEQAGVNTGGLALTADDLVFGSELGGFIFRTGVDYNGNFTATGNEVMRISTSGNVGIGTNSPSQKLHLVGNLRVQGSTDCTLGNGSGGTSCSSDLRLKEKVTPIQGALKKISTLNGVSFQWNDLSLSPGRRDIGVIAQDVEQVFPSAVSTDEGEPYYKRVDYAVLIAPMIEAIKELKSQNEVQSLLIQKLQARVSQLETQR
ncbi:MAG: tail fiber domain-containing protein [Bdellovibrionaceae bacterium]|nr:tail fiber domain-containing protein [Pseudobdellovibrionaceae bacterium]